MFHVQAFMAAENEILLAYLCSESCKAIRDWILSPMETNRDIIYLKSIPTSVGKRMTAFEFQVGKWWLTRVVLTRSRAVTIQEFRANAHALNRLGAIISCQVQVEDPLVFKLLAFEKDGLPKLLPAVPDPTRRVPAFSQTYAANLLQQAAVPLRDAYTLEVADFPYASSRQEVAAYHSEYSARLASIHPEAEPVSRSPGIAPDRDLNINSTTPRVTGTFFPPQQLMVDIVNTQATGPMTTEYNPRPRMDSGPRPSRRTDFWGPPSRVTPPSRAASLSMPPPATRTSTPAGPPPLHRARASLRHRTPVIRHATAQADPVTPREPVVVTINKMSEGRLVATVPRDGRATDSVSAEGNIGAGPSSQYQPPPKKKKVFFDVHGPGIQSSNQPDVVSQTSAPSQQRPAEDRILDDSAILATGGVLLADFSMDNISNSEDEDDDNIQVVAEVNRRNRPPAPVITLSSDSSLNTTPSLEENPATPKADSTSSAEASLTEHSSDSGLPHSFATTTDPPTSEPSSMMVEFNSSDDQYLLDVSRNTESNITAQADATMEEGEVADDETSGVMEDASVITEEANILAADSDKSDAGSDTDKDRKAGQ